MGIEPREELSNPQPCWNKDVMPRLLTPDYVNTFRHSIMQRHTGNRNRKAERRSLPFLFILLLLSSYTLQAQNPGRRPGAGAGAPSGAISGTIADSASGEAVPGATVAVWRVADSTLATGAIAKPDGGFAIEGLRPGAYYLKVTALGYVPLTVPDIRLTREAPRADLGTLVLIVDESVTDQVTVTAQRSDVEFRADRTIYNVENQPINAGGNAVDVLKNVPQVEVDIDDNISLRGSQNVVVLVNGRSIPLTGEALAGYLKGLSAEGIRSIEVIPNPSAKYDPDGMAGIVNIVLADNRKKENLSGNLTVGAGSNNGYNASGSLNAGIGRLNVFGSYSFRYDERESEGTLFRENRLLDPVTFLDQTSENHRIDRSHVVNTSLEYALSATSSLTASALLNVGSETSGGFVNYTMLDDSREIASQTTRFSPGTERETSMDYSLGYRWIKEPSRHELTAEARYSVDDEEELEYYSERSRGVVDTIVELQNTRGDEGNTRMSFQIDYVMPLGESGGLQAGYKGELNSLDNALFSETFDPALGEFTPDIDRNNEFIYDQQIHALYAIVDRKFGRFDAQIGLRAEQAMTDFNLTTTGETFDKEYFSLFPSGALAYELDDARRLRLSYSKRISRPRVWSLNPFPQYDDRLNLRIGNPYLDPEYTHSVELGFNQFAPWGTFGVSPYFRRTTDRIERFLTIDTNGITTLTQANFDYSDSYGAEFVGTYRIREKLTGFVNLSLYRVVLNGESVDADLSNDAIGWSARVNGTWTIVPGLDLQASYFYRAPAGISNGKMKAMHSADIAVKKSLFDDQASLSLRVSDPFNTRGFGMWRDDPEYYIESNRSHNSRAAWLSFAWNFGQETRKSQRRRGEEREESEPPAGMDF